MVTVPSKNQEFNRKIEEGKIFVTVVVMKVWWLDFCELIKVKGINRESGEGAATCAFYEELDSIHVLGTRAASNQVQLVDSGSESMNTVPQKVALGELDAKLFTPFWS